MSPQAVLFDLDNTLTHRALSIEQYAQRFLSDYAHALTRSVSIAEVAKLIVTADNGGYLPAGSPYPTIREAVGRTLAESLRWTAPMAMNLLVDHWTTHFAASAVAMPDAEVLLQELGRRGIACGVISNGAERSRRRTIEALPFSNLIQVVISSEAFGYSKPSPEIFKAGAEALGYLPEQCVFVGDHPHNDYQGARSSGMQAVWLKGFHDWPKILLEPTCSIYSLSELLPLLKHMTPSPE
ncbi:MULTISPECIES: HAD family hydrolase [Pseudomonas]|jgi:putative hydrolase of the HAD superfamily|uniref:HAD family hydrolase n=1 Tax=Pseudomonas yamanorum TaxID=515393 RepID=A0A7Y8JQD3_9PSED|nr:MULTISPECIES: HAD family hydrolase [Pseudomonas]MDF3199084.1 HAD family hydrolase [Pseudomonas sp. 1912-s]NWE14793.1 HAD family hydrolase [Pseudomonas yamanorum]